MFTEYRKKIELLMKQHTVNDQAQDQERIQKATGDIRRQKLKAIIPDPYFRRRDPRLRKGASRRYLFVVDKGKPSPYSQRMVEMVDSPAGRHAYAQKMGIVEPVFGNIKNNKRMNRFTLSGLPKVMVQWLYYCLSA